VSSNLPFRHHVLICTGPRCGGERHSRRVGQEFRREFVRQSLLTGIKETECICFGLCTHGPNVIIYPEGVVYSGVRPQDVAEIVREHLIRGRVIERLLYRRPAPSEAPSQASDDPGDVPRGSPSTP
jgi:(2Fe-2S) ferredoxin